MHQFAFLVMFVRQELHVKLTCLFLRGVLCHLLSSVPPRESMSVHRLGGGGGGGLIAMLGMGLLVHLTHVPLQSRGDMISMSTSQWLV